jgi:putative transposase
MPGRHFENYYHFIADSPKPQTLRKLIRQLHSVTTIEINRIDASPDRNIWFQYWDSHLTFYKSYLARLSYVHQNAARHGLVRMASNTRGALPDGLSAAQIMPSGARL